MSFTGAKMALFIADQLAVILRDDTPGLPFAGYWDMPGGGRDGNETPFACAQRECVEELGVEVPKGAIVWERSYQTDEGIKWFFVARLDAQAAQRIVFGNEGQRWTLMSVPTFLAHPKAVPAFQARLQDYLDAQEKQS